MHAALVFVLFWPALILSVVVSAIGIARRSPALLWTGALLSLPASLYLAASPRFGLTALLLPLCHGASALLVRRDLRLAASLPLLVFAGFFGWFGWYVAQQDPTAPLPPGPSVTEGGRATGSTAAAIGPFSSRCRGRHRDGGCAERQRL